MKVRDRESCGITGPPTRQTQRDCKDGTHHHPTRGTMRRSLRSDACIALASSRRLAGRLPCGVNPHGPCRTCQGGRGLVEFVAGLGRTWLHAQRPSAPRRVATGSGGVLPRLTPWDGAYYAFMEP